jgi:hypothetical protein
MVAMKRQTVPPRRTLVTMFLAIALMFISVLFVIFYRGEVAMNPNEETPFFLAGSRLSSSISSKESYGWFNDIPDEGWKLMKLRANLAVQYMHPYQPQTGYENPVLWYSDNLQVSTLFIC